MRKRFSNFNIVLTHLKTEGIKLAIYRLTGQMSCCSTKSFFVDIDKECIDKTTT